jgi:hypothetical protein
VWAGDYVCMGMGLVPVNIGRPKWQIGFTTILLLIAIYCRGQDVWVEKWPSMKRKANIWEPEVRRCVNGKMGLIGAGNVCKCVYDSIGDFSYVGVAIVDSEGKKGVLNDKGENIVPCSYERIEIGDRCLYLTQFNRVGCIKFNGKWILPTVYEHIYSDFYGRYEYFSLSGNKGWGVADSRGRVIIPAKYTRVRWQGSEALPYFGLVDSSKRVGIADTNGVILFPLRYHDIFLVNYQTAVARVDSVWYVLNYGGQKKAIGKFNRLKPVDVEATELMEFYDNKGSGIVDLDGKVIVSTGFERILRKYYLSPTNTKLYLQVRDSAGRRGVLSEEGELIVPLKYREIDLHGGKLWCYGVDGSAIFDSVGNCLLSVPYANIKPLSETRYLVGRDGAWGMVSATGRLLLDTLSKGIEHLGGGVYKVKGREGNESAVDSNGVAIIPPQYMTVRAYDDGFFYVTDTQGADLVIDANNRKVVSDLVAYDKRFKDGLLRLNCNAMIFAERDGSVIRAHAQRRRYSDVGEFRFGRAMVTDSTGFCGYIDRQGSEIVPCVFLAGGSFSCGIAAVYYFSRIKNNSKSRYSQGMPKTSSRLFDTLSADELTSGWGFIDTAGGVKVPFKYSRATDCRKNIIAVVKERRWGVIKTDDSAVTSFSYDEPFYFQSGLAVAKRNRIPIIIDTAERVIATLHDSCEYYAFDDFGTALVMDGKENAGRISRKGELVVPPKFELVSATSGDSAFAFLMDDSVDHESKIGFLGFDGNMLVAPKYYSFEASTVSPYLVVSNDSGYGILNRKLQPIVPFRYDEIRADEYNQGLFATMKDDKWGYINTKGLWVVMPKYDEARPFSEGLAAVKKDDVWMYIDKKGKEVLRFEGSE